MDRNSKEFKALQQEWYATLRETGFEDIEQSDGNLKIWHSKFFKVNHNETLFSAKEEYYRLAGNFLHEYKFETRKQMVIWELHATGMSVVDITATLKKKRFRVHKNGVHNTIQYLARKMLTWKKET